MAVPSTLELLDALAAKVNETLVLDEVLALAVRHTLTVTKAQRGFLLLDESRDDTPLLVVKAAFDADGKVLESHDISRSTCESVFRSREPAIVVDALDGARSGNPSASMLALDLRTVMCVPLVAKGNAFGVLYVDSEAVMEFNQGDLEFLKLAARHAANAIANARILTAAGRLVNRLKMVNDLAAKVNQSLDVEEVMRLVVLHMLTITRAQRGFLLLTDGSKSPFDLKVKVALTAPGKGSDKAGISLSTCVEVFKRRLPKIVLDAMQEGPSSPSASILALDLRTVMCVPLMSKGEPFGVLYVDSESVVEFGQEDLDLLVSFAQHAANGIENALLYAKLSKITEAYRTGPLKPPGS